MKTIVWGSKASGMVVWAFRACCVSVEVLPKCQEGKELIIINAIF